MGFNVFFWRCADCLQRCGIRRRRFLVYAAAGALKDLFTPLFMHKMSNHFDENDRAEGLSLIYTQPCM